MNSSFYRARYFSELSGGFDDTDRDGLFIRDTPNLSSRASYCGYAEYFVAVMKDGGVYIIARGQDALMPAHIAGDEGNQIFVICQKMGEAVMRKKVEPGRPFLAKANLEFIQYLTHDEVELIRKIGVKQFMKPEIADGI